MIFSKRLTFVADFVGKNYVMVDNYIAIKSVVMFSLSWGFSCEILTMIQVEVPLKNPSSTLK